MTNRSGRLTAAKLPRFVRRAELRLIVPLADTTIYDMECKGEFPQRNGHSPQA